MKKQEKTINSYRLHPKNLRYSSEDSTVAGVSEKDLIISQFVDTINGFTEPFSIEMVRDYEDLKFNKTVIPCRFDTVILNTPQKDANVLFEQNSIGYTKTDTRKWNVLKEYPEYVVLEDGLYCKTYALCVVPGELDPGWIYSIYSVSDVVKMHITPIHKDKHKSVINNHKSTTLSKASTTDLVNTDDVLAIRELVLKENNSEGLFMIKINVSILSDSLEGLAKRQKKFEAETNSTMILNTAKHIQKQLLYGIRGDPFLVIRSSFAAFMPFYTSELYEDGGFLLGTNTYTGHPFKWNPQNRMNKNMVLVAPSGSGKTTTAMLIINCFEMMYPNSFIFGIDPENEYRALGDNMGFSYIDYSPDVQIGLDIFKMLPDVHNACETLCQALNIPDVDREYPSEAAAKLRDTPMTERSFFKFYDILTVICDDESIIRPFRILTKEPYRNFFDGPLPKSNKIIISLKNIGSAGGMVHRLITQIALSYALGRCIQMPKVIPKLVMLDEVWMLFKHESLAGYIENMSRRGRKYNMYMMLATQNMEDLVNNASAKTVVVNSDTVVFMKQNKLTIGTISENFDLSKLALGELMKFKIGQALISYGNDIVPVDIKPDSYQLKLFRPR